MQYMQLEIPNFHRCMMHMHVLVTCLLTRRSSSFGSVAANEVLQAYFQPWKSSALNLVDTILQSLFLTLLGVGLGGLEHSESAVDVFHLLGALFCIALLVDSRLKFHIEVYSWFSQHKRGSFFDSLRWITFILLPIQALGSAIIVVTLAIAMDKIWNYHALGTQIASLGSAPDAGLLVDLQLGFRKRQHYLFIDNLSFYRSRWLNLSD